jgi:hypothetical protein
MDGVFAGKDFEKEATISNRIYFSWGRMISGIAFDENWYWIWNIYYLSTFLMVAIKLDNLKSHQ